LRRVAPSTLMPRQSTGVALTSTATGRPTSAPSDNHARSQIMIIYHHTRLGSTLSTSGMGCDYPYTRFSAAGTPVYRPMLGSVWVMQGVWYMSGNSVGRCSRGRRCELHPDVSLHTSECARYGSSRSTHQSAGGEGGDDRGSPRQL
jgi:hypothetical protein